MHNCNFSKTYTNLKEKVPNVINGKLVQSKTTNWIDVTNKATNEVIARVPESTKEEMEAAVNAAQEAFKSWSKISVANRVRHLFRYQQLLVKHQV